MHVIELIIKNTPMPLSVQRKSLEDAKTVYQEILTAIESGGHKLIKLTCERQPEKELAVFADEIIAVQLYEKSGAAASGKTTGFVSFVES
jgi:hypothetical protein